MNTALNAINADAGDAIADAMTTANDAITTARHSMTDTDENSTRATAINTALVTFRTAITDTCCSHRCLMHRWHNYPVSVLRRMTLPDYQCT